VISYVIARYLKNRKILYDTKCPTCFVSFFQTLSKSIALQSRPAFKQFCHSARHFFQISEEKRRIKFHYSLFCAAKTKIFRTEFYVFLPEILL